MKKGFYSILYLIPILLIAQSVFGQDTVSLQNNLVKMSWKEGKEGWRLNTLLIKQGGSWINFARVSGENTILYSAEKPDPNPAQTFKTNTGVPFPEEVYSNGVKKKWMETTTEVALNTAGTAYQFFPGKAEKKGDQVVLKSTLDIGTVVTEWSMDPQFPTDIVVKQILTVKKDGYYSMASPTLATVTEKNLSWVTVPGYFQGNKVNKDFVAAYGYGHGIPELPVVYRERAASTLCPMITANNGITYAVIPEPGLARDPWEKDQSTSKNWNIGLSHKNRRSDFSPTLYYPVLGEPKSLLKAGDVITYSFRYSLSDGDWFKMLNHAVYDIYKFKETLALRKNKEALSVRMEKIHDYVINPATSLWKTDTYKNRQIGAQAYLGGVVGSDKDAMKNSDYGAMWMLASLTGDTALTKGRLPYALNFKLAQQYTGDGFFNGGVEGQYYLYKSDRFVEEWGSIVEPIGVTYYVISDMANILLYEPDNQELKDRIRLGADLLLKWQKRDGSWAVAYDHQTEKEVYRDVKDLRPTFYGLLIAYQVLKDRRYLDAAVKGADWYIENAVNTGSFLGVCGDARYMADFATGQSAQVLLDLFDATGIAAYKDAAIRAAKIYTASVYTHPVPNRTIKTVKGVQRQDWEIAQSGLSFEHGGILGSANSGGPILLCSHAGLFIRMFEYTGEPIFRDMARTAAIGRDAFVDPATSVASYYWSNMNKGPGPFPHHAWWQIGWITDYLMSEAHLRSEGKIVFPRGYITPKVGPHQSYGFKAGKVFGETASLASPENLLVCDRPQVEYIAAHSENGSKAFVILMNTETEPVKAKVSWESLASRFKKISVLDDEGHVLSAGSRGGESVVEISSYGLKVIVLE